MFVKFFKDRSNKKFINKAIENRSSSVNSNKIQTVGIILNIGEFKDYDKLRDIFKNYGINENKIKFIAFLSENDTKLNNCLIMRRHVPEQILRLDYQIIIKI